MLFYHVWLTHKQGHFIMKWSLLICPLWLSAHFTIMALTFLFLSLTRSLSLFPSSSHPLNKKGPAGSLKCFCDFGPWKNPSWYYWEPPKNVLKTITFKLFLIQNWSVKSWRNLEFLPKDASTCHKNRRIILGLQKTSVKKIILKERFVYNSFFMDFFQCWAEGIAIPVQYLCVTNRAGVRMWLT